MEYYEIYKDNTYKLCDKTKAEVDNLKLHWYVLFDENKFELYNFKKAEKFAYPICFSPTEKIGRLTDILIVIKKSYIDTIDVTSLPYYDGDLNSIKYAIRDIKLKNLLEII